jgi:hypothetical protein
MPFQRGQAKIGGRKKGTPNKRTAAVREAGDRAIAQMKDPFEGDGYALLAMIYKDRYQPLSVRMSAANMAVPYERPRLSNVEMTTRSLDRMTDEEFFRAWESVARFLAQHGRPKLLDATAPFDESTSAELEGGLSAAGRGAAAEATRQTSRAAGSKNRRSREVDVVVCVCIDIY